jgi:hypothetical protein
MSETKLEIVSEENSKEFDVTERAALLMTKEHPKKLMDGLQKLATIKPKIS